MFESIGVNGSDLIHIEVQFGCFSWDSQTKKVILGIQILQIGQTQNTGKYPRCHSTITYKSEYKLDISYFQKNFFFCISNVFQQMYLNTFQYIFMIELVLTIRNLSELGMATSNHGSGARTLWRTIIVTQTAFGIIPQINNGSINKLKLGTITIGVEKIHCKKASKYKIKRRND